MHAAIKNYVVYLKPFIAPEPLMKCPFPRPWMAGWRDTVSVERCSLPPREETLVVNVVCWHVLLTLSFSAGHWSTLILYQKTTRPKHPEPAGPDRTSRSLNRKNNRLNNDRLQPGTRTPQPPDTHTLETLICPH